MKTIKLAVIGGGSVNWMRHLMKDIYLSELEGGEIRLVDPNVEHVTSVRNMLLKFNELTGKHFDVSIAEDRLAALSGCDFVLTTFSPGAMDAFYNDLELPTKYGVRLPVSMTCGVSGISAAIRTVPVAYEITEEMERVCPGAVLINVTNPMCAVTRAFNLPAKTVTVFGLCHEIHSMPQFCREMFGLPRPDGMPMGEYLYSYLQKQGFSYKVAGINHFIWLTEATLHGQDVLERVREYARTHNEIYYDDVPIGATTPYRNNGQAKLALCRQFGYLPIPGDRHLVEFWPSLCNPQNGFGMGYGVQKTTVDSRRLDKVLQKQEIDAIARGEAQPDWTPSGEDIADLILSYVNGTELLTCANLPNVGQISNLPRGYVVETLARKEKDGSVTPLGAGALPEPIRVLCDLQLSVTEMAVQAALTGDRRLLIEALSLDPSTGTMDFCRIPDLCDDLLRANKQWLPRFFA